MDANDKRLPAEPDEKDGQRVKPAPPGESSGGSAALPPSAGLSGRRKRRVS